MLKEIFIALVLRYNADVLLAEKLWSEIEKAYTGKKRYYHNLSHIEALYQLLLNNRSSIHNWDVVLFSLFYHDIVYNVLKKNNEQKSADIAVKRLNEIGFPGGHIELCFSQIIATSKHLLSDDKDTNIFTDADLSVLGKETAVYDEYCKQIRKEYSIFPDFVYIPGRKKVINHFLQMERIFKTDIFFNQYEQQAKENLYRELNK